MQEGTTVLVVDDAADARAMYGLYLAYHGFRVIEATDGFEAVRQTVEALPAVVLMDLGLPHLDGWEATRRIKADPRTRHIPVVAISGHSYPDAVRRAMDAGADAFFTKPCLPETVLAKIRLVLDA
jgi:CheY-like chemotaxis protein